MKNKNQVEEPEPVEEEQPVVEEPEPAVEEPEPRLKKNQNKLKGSWISWIHTDGSVINSKVEKITDKKYKICCKPGKKSGDKGSIYQVDKSKVKLVDDDEDEDEDDLTQKS